ncbi:DsbA family oxidoreductase [Streptomyces sp. PU-14G]|uniref:DsbA family oxidoreductase n=1 Tax=Streptomyces sp. PU-14G TaxID=2800808 RepID=UPI0034DF7C3C
MLTVEVWSDIVCPWCYLGKRRWERAMAGFPHAQEVNVVWRAFELRRNQPRLPGGRLSELMTANYGMQPSEIAEVFDTIRALGVQEGITLRPEQVRPVNSFDAHRICLLAADAGAGATMLDILFHAYHAETRNIADHGVLRELAAEAGLPDGEVAAVLSGDRYAHDVRAQEEAARAAGVTSVPSFVVDGRQVLHGVAEAENMLAMLNEEWERKTPPGDGHAPRTA